MNDNPGLSLFQGGALTIDNALQNQEEDEDLEEQKRRQVEIQDFLTNAMDDFNYDDQSSVNSSTNISINRSSYVAIPSEEMLFAKYKSAPIDDQLKVLYEIRVKEIKELTEKVSQLEVDVKKQRDLNGKKCMLLEADKNRAQITLEQSQALLVVKSEEITSLNTEMVVLKDRICQLEETINRISEEYGICKQSNKDLMDQLEVMRSGFTTNTISDRVLQEQHHAEISQMHHMLDVANTKLYKKEKECKEVEDKLKMVLSDKDALVVEKTSIINKLTNNLEDAQTQCHGLLAIVEKVSQENKSLKQSIDEQQASAKTMNLSEKMEYIGALQRELAKAHDKYIKQQTELSNLQKNYEEINDTFKSIKQQNDGYQADLDSWKNNYRTLEEEFKKLEATQNQLENQRSEYEAKISELEKVVEFYELKSKARNDEAAQVSFSFIQSKLDDEEKSKLRVDLLNANEEINDLQTRLLASEEQISKLQIASNLEKERESLIRNLQEKAAQFEKVIKERQTQPDRFSIGINTESNPKIESLKEDLESEFVRREIELRTDLKNDYDRRLEKVEQEFAKRSLSQDKKCTNCDELTNKLRKLEVVTYNKDESISALKSQMKQDRHAVSGLLETWKNKFVDMETEKSLLLHENLEIRNRCNELDIKLKSYDAGSSKLYQVIKSECEETIKLWNKNMIEKLENYTKTQKENLLKSFNRVDHIFDKADAEVAAIEMKFLRKKQSFQQFKFTHR